MSEPLARLYDLALRTLDDQERRADALRSRLGPVLAAAALGVTLLSGPVVGGTAPTRSVGRFALIIAIGGFFVAVVAAVLMMGTRRHAPSDIDVRALAERLRREGTLDDLSSFYSTMIAQLSRESRYNGNQLDRLRYLSIAMLCGILVMLCGLAAAALVG